jgi:hypothetical protein
MRNISEKVVQKIKTQFMYHNFFFPFESRVSCETMWKTVVEPERPLITIWRLRIAFWIPKATNTQLEYVILIAFPLQRWLYDAPQSYIIRTNKQSCSELRKQIRSPPSPTL